MAKKTISVSVIIPDAGPLLTLARLDRLDLLDHFDAPIHLVDQVRYEATKRQNDRQGRVGAWLKRKGNSISVIETTVGVGFQTRLDRGEKPRGANLGELAVEEYARDVARLQSPPFIPLVLFEDPDVLDLTIARLKGVHLLNTTAMVRALQRAGVLDEGAVLIDEINRARMSPLEPFERPGGSKRLKSVWKAGKKS